MTSDTISRFIRTLLCATGVYTNIFGAHYFRGAAASKALSTVASLDSISQQAGEWARESTFTRFYRREVDRTVA